jgi:hypothetical protein
MENKLFDSDDIYKVTEEEILRKLPSLSLYDIVIVVEYIYWMELKDIPAFSEMAPPILENIMSRNRKEETYSGGEFIWTIQYLQKRLDELESKPSLVDSIKLEIEMRIALNS